MTDYATTWWQAVEEGTLTAQHCRSCDSLQLYPRRRCVTCSSEQLDYRPLSGRGRIYTFSTIFRNPPSDFIGDLPYTLAIVISEEGPRMLTRVVNCPPESLSCDLPVRAVITDIHGKQLVVFEPA